MTLAMDVRMVAAGAKLGFVFTRRGIVPEACSSWFLPRIVGIAQASEWVLTGRVFGPDEALRGGLVRSVHPGDELLGAARALARELADGTSPVSVAMSRAMLWRMLGEPSPAAAHEIDSRGIFSRGASGDAREGVMAFLEKRDAAFGDRERRPARLVHGLAGGGRRRGVPRRRALTPWGEGPQARGMRRATARRGPSAGRGGALILDTVAVRAPPGSAVRRWPRGAGDP